MRRVYHRRSPQHVSRYGNHVRAPRDIRNVDTINPMTDLMRTMTGQRLRYRNTRAK